MIFRVTRDLNPLELEILQKAFGHGLLTIKENKTAIDLVSDEELEAALRSELTDIARSNGVSDAEAWKDLFFARCLIERTKDLRSICQAFDRYGVGTGARRSKQCVAS